MNPEQWARAKTLFGELLDRDASEWPERLDTEPDQAVAAEVRRLLAANPSGEAFLSDSPAYAETAEDALIGKALGPFTIQRLLGEGGGGRVYLAERMDVGGVAAIKILRARFAGSESTRRFRAEQAILARLDHPNIARLLQVGVTDDGTPWLAMEYIEGQPFSEVMATLTVRQRVEMVIKLLSAVDFAHRQLVVHRDIKPSNIRVDQRGEPRLLDFGIAKRLDDAKLTLTHYQPRTPAYAAPEQVLDEPITVATDVYAMGVLLFEALSGKHPWLHSGKRLDDAILSDAAPLPSALADASNRRQLKGDLDAIVLKAMQRHPQQRYPSAAAMAEDLTRYLERRPVTAQKQTVLYRTRRYVMRNYRFVAAGLLLCVLVGAALQREHGLREAAAAESLRAQLEADKATQVAEFMLDVFSAGDSLTPEFNINRESTVMDLMARGVSRLDDLESAPLVRADLAHSLGQVYWGLSEYSRAEALLRTAISLRESAAAPQDDTAESYMMLGRVFSRTSRYPQMLEAMQASYDLRLDALGPDHPNTIHSLHRVGSVYYHLRELPRAVAIADEAIVAWRELLPDSARNMANSYTIRGLSHLRMGNFTLALESIDEVLRLRRTFLPESHNLIAQGLSNRSRCLFYLGRIDDALDDIRQSIAINEANLPGDHWDHVLSNEKLVLYLVTAGNLTEADQVADKALAMAQRLHAGSPNPELVDLSRHVKVEVLRAQGEHASALALATETLRSREQHLPPLHGNTLATRSLVADLLRRLGRMNEAEQVLNESLDSWRQRPAMFTPELGQSMDYFADAGLCGWLNADWSMELPKPMEATLESSRQACSLETG